MNVWIQRTLFVILAPLLLAQGIYAKKVTPRLPEPAGPRTGREGSGPALRLLIAGDSAAAGVGVDHQGTALSGQLGKSLAPHFDLQWKLIAQTGYTTINLLERLSREPEEEFDVAVLSLGVNDVTGAVRAHSWLAQQQALVLLLQQRFQIKHVVLSSLPPVNEFHALPQPLRTMLGARARRFNRLLAGAIDTWPGCELLSMVPPRDPEALASDGFHPGPSTYNAWATQLAELINPIAAAQNSPARAS